MVSALNSGSSDPGSSLGQGTALCSWPRHFTLTVALFTQGPVGQNMIKLNQD